MSKDVIFTANWFNDERLASVQHASVVGVTGSSERIQLREKLSDLKEKGKLVDPVSIPSSLLKGWAHGAIAGWSQEQVATRVGPMPMGDGDRNLIRLSCKALKVWEYVCGKLPTLPEDEKFTSDIDDEDLVDTSDSEEE